MRREQRPFESWDELRMLALALGPHYGPMVLFAAATGLRPAEWTALEHRDIDRIAGVVLVRRAFRNGRVKLPKTPNSVRAVVEPGHRIYDLRHTFATFALRAGLSTFDLSRYMGASLTMIDRHYGYLARDGRQHAISMLNAHATRSVDAGGRSVDTSVAPASSVGGAKTA